MHNNILIFCLGMGKEVENLIMENNELLATKYVFFLSNILIILGTRNRPDSRVDELAPLSRVRLEMFNN